MINMLREAVRRARKRLRSQRTLAASSHQGGANSSEGGSGSVGGCGGTAVGRKVDVVEGIDVAEVGTYVESEVGVGVVVVGGIYVEVDPGFHVSHNTALPLKGRTRNIVGSLVSRGKSLLYDSRMNKETTMENVPA